MEKKLRIVTIGAALFCAAALMLTGCKPAITTAQTKDTTAPEEVTDLKVLSGSKKISISWKNPVDDGLYQVKIRVAKTEDPTVVKSLYVDAVAGKEGGTIVGNLERDTNYTVTLITIDKAGNKSAGKSETVKTKLAGAVSRIELKPSSTEKTNGNVTVTVTASTPIKEAKWMKNVKNASEVLASGTVITDTKFEVAENGVYSVAVLGTDGQQDVETINIENIDKTPPAPVTGLAAAYSPTDKKITVSWTNPSTPDLAGLTVNYKKEGGEETAVALEKDKTGSVIENIAPDGSKYTITVKAKDDAGNERAAEPITVTAIAVTDITLDRTHFDTEQSDRNIQVTVTGSGFDKLTSFKVQVKADGGFAETPVAVDKATGKATVRAPLPPSTYTVRVIADGTPVLDKTATFKVTRPAQVNEIALSKDKIKFGTETKVTVTVKGTNFDLRGETKIKLLDSKKAEVTTSTVTVAETEGTETEFSKEITLPSKMGFYTVAVFFKDRQQNTTKTLQLYGEPEITAVTIPKAGKSYSGKLPVIITGKNFTAPDVSADKFSGSGATFTNFKVVNDALVTAEVECPSAEGETNVTVSCGTGSNQSKEGDLSVKDYGTGYEVGNIVLADKTTKTKDDYTAINTSNPPVGIICGSFYGAPKMLALHTRGSYWAKNGSTGYNTKFEGIICTPSKTGSGAAETATFEGDTDGSDNWEYIKSIDAEGTAGANAEANYPAFNWVSQYNTTYEDKLGGTAFNWYMPSLAELCAVYKSREAINASLTKINGFNDNYADAELGNNWYWSSSQGSSPNDYAWVVYFGFGGVDYYYKSNDFRVCCIAGF